MDLEEGSAAKGLPVAQRAADAARIAKQPDVEVEALIVWCELLRDLGDVNGALQVCDRALKVASGGKVSRRTRAEVLRAKGVLLRRAGRLSGAVEAHAEAIAVFKAVGARRSEARARNALGFALFVLGRYEDTIAICLSSIGIDVMIGGRFQVAKTLANIGMSYARLGDIEHGLAYLGRAREAHERYDDHDGRVDTLLVTASVLIEQGNVDAATEYWADASALGTVTGTVYDKIHLKIVRAMLARAQKDSQGAVGVAAEARQMAESQGLVAFHVFAMAIEAVGRIDIGDNQVGVLLATNALGAVEAMEGSEYGVEVRAACVDALLRAHANSETASTRIPATTEDVCRRAVAHVDKLTGYISTPELQESFRQRPPVKSILDHAAQVAGK